MNLITNTLRFAYVVMYSEPAVSFQIHTHRLLKHSESTVVKLATHNYYNAIFRALGVALFFASKERKLLDLNSCRFIFIITSVIQVQK